MATRNYKFEKNVTSSSQNRRSIQEEIDGSDMNRSAAVLMRLEAVAFDQDLAEEVPHGQKRALLLSHL